MLKAHQFMLWTCALLTTMVIGLQFRIQLAANQQRCFFEYLEINQKYKFQIYPIHHNNTPSVYTSSITHMPQPKTNSVSDLNAQSINTTPPSSQPLSLHKLSSKAGPHRFCLQNPTSIPNQYKVDLSTGLELNQLHLLPNNNDTQNVLLELEWLGREVQALRGSVGGGANVGTGAQLGLQSRIGLQGGVLAFSLVILGVNLGLYWGITKALAKRKII